MFTRNSLQTIVLLGLACLMGTGCVADRKYRDLEQAYRKSQEQVVELQNRISELEQTIEQLRAGPREAKARVKELQAERDELMAKLEELQGKYETLAQREPVVLPAEIDEKLREFAEEHPDMVTYDSDRGMVKFQSDLTFPSGSADLRSQARQTLEQLGGVLTGPIASEYEVRVVGHTDSVPIGQPSTKEKHPTNWHLSVHRAISVRDALDQAGIPAVRTSVGGYAKYRPLVQNSSSGAEKNRRVEIYLVPMTEVNRDFLSGSGSSSSSGGSGSSDSQASTGGGNSGSGKIPMK